MKLINKYFPELSDLQQAQLQKYSELFCEANKTVNMVSRKDIEHFEEHHLLHCLAMAKVFSFPAGTSVVDVGTGGGLPGIPMSIMFPQTQFVLVDSIGKKIAKVNEFIGELGLDNVKAVWGRVEQLPGKFDMSIGRAVTNLPDFLNLVKPVLRKGSPLPRLVYIKGGEVMEEVHACSKKYEIFEISTLFEEEFFETKKVVVVY